MSIPIDLLHAYVNLQKCGPDHWWFSDRFLLDMKMYAYHVIHVHGLATVTLELFMIFR